MRKFYTRDDVLSLYDDMTTIREIQQMSITWNPTRVNGLCNAIHKRLAILAAAVQENINMKEITIPPQFKDHPQQLLTYCKDIHTYIYILLHNIDNAQIEDYIPDLLDMSMKMGRFSQEFDLAISRNKFRKA